MKKQCLILIYTLIMFIGAVCIVYAANEKVIPLYIKNVGLFCKSMFANITKWVIGFGAIGATVGFICSFFK